MATFSVIVLVIILIAIQHLLNWLTKLALKDHNCFDLTVIIGILIPLSYLIILTIIKWGQPLIK